MRTRLYVITIGQGSYLGAIDAVAYSWSNREHALRGSKASAIDWANQLRSLLLNCSCEACKTRKPKVSIVPLNGGTPIIG